MFNSKNNIKTFTKNIMKIQYDSAELKATADSVYEKLGKSGFRDFALEGLDDYGLIFEGTKRRTKQELQKMMYLDKMDEWLEEADKEDSRRALEFQNSVLRDTEGSDDEHLQIVSTGNHNNDEEVVTIRRKLMNQPRASLPART